MLNMLHAGMCMASHAFKKLDDLLSDVACKRYDNALIGFELEVRDFLEACVANVKLNQVLDMPKCGTNIICTCTNDAMLVLGGVTLSCAVHRLHVSFVHVETAVLCCAL